MEVSKRKLDHFFYSYISGISPTFFNFVLRRDNISDKFNINFAFHQIARYFTLDTNANNVCRLSVCTCSNQRHCFSKYFFKNWMNWGGAVSIKARSRPETCIEGDLRAHSTNEIVNFLSHHLGRVIFQVIRRDCRFGEFGRNSLASWDTFPPAATLGMQLTQQQQQQRLYVDYHSASRQCANVGTPVT
jgi:hypothetical protein